MSGKLILDDGMWMHLNVTLPISIFSRMNKHGFTFQDLKNVMSEFHETRNKFISANIGNTGFHFTKQDTQFTIAIRTYRVTVWDSTGDMLLGEKLTDSINSVPTTEFVEWIEDLTDDYIKGTVYCSDCGAPVDLHHIPCRQYAGVYCKECAKKIKPETNYD